MKTAFFLVFFAAIVLVQVWTRLSAKTRAKIETKAKAMINAAKNIAQGWVSKIFRRRMSYKALFLTEKGELSPAGKIVLADLTKFCRGMTSTTVVSPTSGMVDSHASGLAEGRREVWLRIMKELGLDAMEAIHAVRDEEDALAAA